MLNTTLLNIKLRNPLILASGILGVTKESINRVAKSGAGAVTLKSLCHEERKGHPAPNMIVFEHGMLNAVGLPGQGIVAASKDFGRLDDLDVPVIGSIYGYTIPQFGQVAKQMARLKPALIEVDVSCPHMKYDQPYYASGDAIHNITKQVKKNSGKIPVSIKLSPNVHNIAELAHQAQRGGADAITAINAASGMKIDLTSATPILGNKTGGMTGPALKPIAVRCVYEIFQTVKIPIIGTGGVMTGEDALEMIMAGAKAVGVGTALYYRGEQTFSLITKEMKTWMRKHKVKNIAELYAKAHRT